MEAQRINELDEYADREQHRDNQGIVRPQVGVHTSTNLPGPGCINNFIHQVVFSVLQDNARNIR